MRRRFPAAGSVLAGIAIVLAAPACGHSQSKTSNTTNGGQGGAGVGTAGNGVGGDSLGGDVTGGGGSAGQTQGSAGDPGTAGAPNIKEPKEKLSHFIVVDQFGYRPNSEKIAVIRDPQTGFDASDSYTPGPMLELVDASTGAAVLTAAPTAWHAGATDASSGDKAWWFDFTSVTAPGTYYVLDPTNSARSDLFDISETVYREVLKRAVRMFFYQRVGQAKDAKWAGAGWADTADHVGPGQDHEARSFLDQKNAATAKDLWGGWFDAGDYNKYTSWTASYVVSLLRAYLENPGIWRDDYEIPESGNGIPDVLDEAKWGLDYLSRLQNSDGSVLSIVGEGGGSPPSTAKDPTFYGSPNTSGTLSTAGAYALGARVLGALGNADLKTYATGLQGRAVKAWAWASANPSVVFKNNDFNSGTSGLGAGQQETDDYGRTTMKLEAAVYLFELTGDTQYQAFFDANYTKTQLFPNNFAYPFQTSVQEALLYYTTLSGATAATKTAILKAYGAGMNSGDNFGSVQNNSDPYLAYLKDYTWGSNAVKSNQGMMFSDVVQYGVDKTKNADALRAAERYVHYLHGVNPMGFVYLSNMYAYGAANGVNEFYHSWFCNGSANWDRVGVSKYGPAPGFLVGGANPSYAVDTCCGTDGCSGNSCTGESLTPPEGQPPQKSYKDFNTSWPIDSWQITENSDGYQVAYLRLLSKFVK